MDTLIKADIFFFITAVAVVALTIVLTVALIYVVRILRRVLFVTRRVQEESEKVMADIETLRQEVKKSGRQIRDDAVQLSGKVRGGGEKMVDDLSQAGEVIRREAGLLRRVFTYLSGFLTITTKGGTRSKKNITSKKKTTRKK